MSVPYGSIVNTAVSLTKSVKNPNQSNIVAAVSDAVSISNNPTANNAVRNAAPLLTSAFQSLGGGRPFNLLNGVNQAVRLSSGFMDPETARIAGAVTGGLNSLFGANGVFGGISASGQAGNKPYALHTDSLTSQEMSSAYGEQNDVVFSFVRADSATEEAMFGVDDGGLNGTADNLSGKGALASPGSGLSKSIGSVSPASSSINTSYTGASVASPSSTGLTTSLSGKYF